MDCPTTDQDLAAAKHEIQQLKDKLNEKEIATRDLEMDLNFHVMKSRELQDMLDQQDTDEYQEKVQAKLLQNAGLSAQVQTLRQELGQSSMRQAELETELKEASETVERLGEERRSNQRMLGGLSDVVRLLGEIDVENEKLEHDEFDWRPSDQSFDNIKLKIYAIEKDRQKQIQENQDLQTEILEKAIEVRSYEKQVEQLQAEQQSHKALLCNLDEVDQLLGDVDINHEYFDNDRSKCTEQDQSFEKIKSKVEAMKKDSQRQAQENRELQKSLSEKIIEISSYQKQVKQLQPVRESHEKILEHVGEINELLGEIDTNHEALETDKFDSYMSPEHSFGKIKLKIHEIEEDRQNQIQQNHQLQVELSKNAREGDPTAQQTRIFQVVSDDRDRIKQERDDLKLALESKDTLIKSLEESLASRMIDSSSLNHGPPDVAYERKYVETSAEEFKNCPEEIEVKLADDGSAIIVPGSARGSGNSASPLHSEIECQLENRYDDDVCSLSSLESSKGPSEKHPHEEENIHESLRNETSELKQKLEESRRHQEESNIRNTSLRNEIVQLKDQLIDTRKQLKTTRKKQELRDKLLRDVIFQYKELQNRYDEANARLCSMELANLEIDQDDPEDPTKTSESDGHRARTNSKRRLGKQTTPNVEESSTCDTVDSSQSTMIQGISMDATPTSSTHTGMNGVELIVEGQSISEKDYAQLVKEAVRLEHEYEDAITQVANLEHDLDMTREELERVKSKNLKSIDEISELQEKYEHLQADYDEALERSTKVQDELNLAQAYSIETRDRLTEREDDLREVIDQYKELAKEKEDTFIKMQGVQQQLDETKTQLEKVEHELAIATRHAKRKDLIYDHLRMERQIKDYEVQVEALSRDLKFAKTEAARSKEETKGTRKRLVGCHFQYRHLQAKYDEIASLKSALEEDYSKAERSVQNYKAQQHILKAKITHVQNLRRKATFENQKLMEENTELINAYCNDILTLASERVEVM